jgi:opacity protein-like surface antigen
MKSKISPKLVILLAVVLLSCGAAFSQTQGGVNRIEFFGGYSHSRVDTTLDSDDFEEDIGGRFGANGVNISVTANFTKYIGAKVDYAHHQKREDFVFDAEEYELKYTNDTIMGGIQVKNNAKDGPRLKPFFHGLAGISRQKLALTTFDISEGQSNFTFAVGGGLDIRVHKNVDIRVFQIDYNPTYIKDFEIDGSEINGRLQNNFRFGFGIAFH